MGGIGPMMGQVNVFFRYFPEQIQPAIDHYQHECRRLFEVLDRRLGESPWLGHEYAIADSANWCWVRTYRGPGVALDGLLNTQMLARRPESAPGVPQGHRRAGENREPAQRRAGRQDVCRAGTHAAPNVNGEWEESR